MTGSARPVISFTISAPATNAARATPACRVSTESNAPGNSQRRASTTGTTRCNSSSTAISTEPGRVDSPPISIISAPAASRLRACATAAGTPTCRPPSEKESGVTFRIPITAPAAGNLHSPRASCHIRPLLISYSRVSWCDTACCGLAARSSARSAT